MLTYIWDTNAPKGVMQSASSIPLVHIFAMVCQSGAGRCQPLDRREPQCRGRLRAGVRQARAARERICVFRSIPNTRAAPPRATSAKSPSAARSSNDPGYGRDRLHRKPSGRELCARPARPVRCLLRPRAGGRASAGRRRSRVEGDLATGAGIEEALRGVDTVIHLAGVTKALRAAGLLRRQRARHRRRWPAPLRGPASASSTSARWPRSGPSRGGVPVGEDAEPHPSTHYGKSKLEAERVVRDLASRCGDRAPAGGVRAARYRRLPAAEIDFQGPGAGDRRRRALVQRDLRRGSGGRHCSPLRRPPARAGTRPISWRIAKPVVLERTRRPPRPRIMARQPAVVRVPARRGALRVGLCAEIWSRVTRKPGIVSREKIARSALRGMDLRSLAAPPPSWVSTQPPTLASTGWRNSRLVQGGRLAKLLKPRAGCTPQLLGGR